MIAFFLEVIRELKKSSSPPFGRLDSGRKMTILATFYGARIKKELRRSASNPVATVGRAYDVPGGIWVVPIGYDAEVNRWVLDKPTISVDHKLYEGFFSLRTQPKEAGRTRTLDEFMEST